MSISLETITQEYEFDCTARGHAITTLKAYRTALRQFIAFVNQHDVNTVDDLRTPIVRAFAAHCMRELSPGGAHARLRVVRSFLRWATQEGYFAQSPMDRVPMPRLSQKILDAVPPQDMRKMMNAAHASDTPLKYQALLAVLYDTGIRVSELHKLQLKDLLPSQCLFIREAKGGKDRVVPISRPTFKLLNNYIRNERPDSALPEIFLVDEISQYSNISIYKLLERLCRRAGTKRYSPHTFRRGFAVNYLRNGGDVFTLQRIMGHSTLTMTNRYAAMGTDDIQDVHRRASPMQALR